MLSRHSLVWLEPSGWRRVQASTTQHGVEIRDALARWQAADWPLVVRRAEPAQLTGQVAVGIALPPGTPAGTGPRIGVIVEDGDIRRSSAPVMLEAVLAQAPAHWRAALLALHLEWSEALPPLQVYGSLAWQHLTGMQFLRESSDIDLLFAPADRHALAQGIRLLCAHAASLPLDGEIVFPGGVAVAWKEWHQATGTGRPAPSAMVLTKAPANVALVSCISLLATLEQTA